MAEMPDFDRVHELASKLAQLTAPGEREPGLITWNVFVGETWEALVRLWDDKAAAADDLYKALEALYTFPGVRNLLAPLDSIGSIAAEVEAALLKAKAADTGTSRIRGRHAPNCAGEILDQDSPDPTDTKPCPRPARWINTDTGSPFCDVHKTAIERMNIGFGPDALGCASFRPIEKEPTP